MSRLKWDMCAITPHDFVDLILTRLGLAASGVNVNDRWDVTRRSTHGLIALCALEYKFTMCPPSMIACACVVAALRGEVDPAAADLSSINDLLAQLHSITHIEIVRGSQLDLFLFHLVFTHVVFTFQDILRGCFEQVEQFLRTLSPGSNLAGSRCDPVPSCPVDASSIAVTALPAKVEHEKPAGTPTDIRDVRF